jgi:hypothetical protein
MDSCAGGKALQQWQVAVSCVVPPPATGVRCTHTKYKEELKNFFIVTGSDNKKFLKKKKHCPVPVGIIMILLLLFLQGCNEC